MLKREGYANLYVDGGATIQGFLRHGLIDELIITRVPVLLAAVCRSSALWSGMCSCRMWIPVCIPTGW
jgi:riboflavin biosynthesis pyrimidine reductase